MKYMIIEKFIPGKAKEIYRRFGQNGRMLPVGLAYIDSWIDENVSLCFQLMETDDIRLLHEWISYWDDLSEFEIIPVINSEAAKAQVMNS